MHDSSAKLSISSAEMTLKATDSDPRLQHLLLGNRKKNGRVLVAEKLGYTRPLLVDEIGSGLFMFITQIS